MKKKTVIICLLVVVFSVAVFQVIKIIGEYHKADEVYENLQNEFVETRPNTEDTLPDETTEVPEPIEQAPITVDFDSLLKENSDIIGWIYCQDTLINYPVVQSGDNSTYLRRDLNGNYLVSGTIFTDYRNGSVGEDRNLILYGHNMKGKTMFGLLVNYKEQSYYDEHPVLYYLTPSGDYKIELYAGVVVSRDSLIYNPNPNEAEFQEFLNYAKENSTFQSGVTIEDDDLFITLSTCSYEYNNARYIVIGKLIKIGRV